MAENCREIVLDMLLTMEREKEYSNRLIRAVLDKYDYLDTKDKGFIKRVAEGTVERRIELDYYLDEFSTVPVRKMKPFVRCLLRMSVYQLLYMDTVPDSAVCNEACKLAARRKFQNLRGFINGVLRSIARSRESLPLPSPEKEPPRYLSVKYSMPEWIVQLWLDEYGRQITETLLEGLLRVHPVSLRFCAETGEAQRKRLLEAFSQTGAVWRQSGLLPEVYLVEKCAGVAALPGFDEGRFAVQDVSSALAVKAAGIRDTDFVMDVCAAPGGKSMLAAETAAQVLARDVSEEKTALIEENAARLRRRNVTVQVHDATVWDETYREKADVLLLDVPCSGLGVLGKKRDIKYHVTPESLSELYQLQRKIVRTCADYVKPGGTLLYSTCTIHAGENEEMVRFISRELGFEPVPLGTALLGEALSQKDEVNRLRLACGRKPAVSLNEREEEACLQLLPGFLETDGFFFARFRRPLQGEREDRV